MGAINPTEQRLLHLQSAPEGRAASVNSVPSDGPPRFPAGPSCRMHPSRISRFYSAFGLDRQTDVRKVLTDVAWQYDHIRVQGTVYMRIERLGRHAVRHRVTCL